MARSRGVEASPPKEPDVPLYLRRATNPYLERQGYLTGSSSRPSTASGGQGSSRPSTATAREQARPSSSSAATRPPPRHQLLQVSCKQPGFVVSDREVLRYYAFFQEPVFDSAADTTADAGFRVRLFVICYYLASSSLSVDEPKQVNSGLAQGMFMNKQQVAKAVKGSRKGGPAAAAGGGGGSLIQPSDFSVGGTIELYGRVFKVVDADEFTRDYHQRTLGVTLAPAQDYPDDGYETRRSFLTRPPRQPQPAKPLPYTQRDQAVLRFFCAYEDERRAGGRRQYTLYYYLVDGTAEIKEVAEPGHVHFPNLLKRQKLPKGGSLFVPTATVESDLRGQDVNREAVPYVSWEDLRCGEAITVYGRHLLLLSCDNSTIDWYAARGVTQVPLHMSMKDTAPPVKIKVAPPNGFGTDDDLYALGLKLEPCKYEDKTTRHERSAREAKVLRFMVHLLRPDGGAHVDSRELILNFFLFDETISIYEPPVRNSGVGGGLFLARGKYKKYIEKRRQQDNNNSSKAYSYSSNRQQKEAEESAAASTTLGGSLSRFLRPSDFLLTSPPVTLEDASTGARLFTLQAVGYDDYTKKMLEGEQGSSSSLVVVTLQKLSESLVAASLPVRSTFRQADKNGCGVLPKEAFVSVLRQLEAQARGGSSSSSSPTASDKELERVCEWFGEGGGGVRYDEAVDALAMCAPKSVFDQAKEAVGAATLTLEERVFKVLSKLLNGGEREGWNLRRTLRQLDEARNGTLDMDAWVKAVKQHGLASLMSRTEAASLLLQYDSSGSAKLSYQVLCDAIFVGDFSPLLPNPPSAAPGPPAAPQQQQQQHVGPMGGGVRRVQGSGASVKQYLQQLTESVITCDGDVRKQLHNAIQSFSSSFSRTARKRILRKIWMAFDGGRTGRITRAQFTAGIEETAAEFRLDFLDRDKQVLGEFIFPDPVKSRVDYERLLEAFCSRDVRACEALREESRAALQTDDALAFRPEDDQRTRDFGGTLKVVGLVH